MRRARPQRDGQERLRRYLGWMQFVLYAHPFSSYSWKALIAFRETETDFVYRSLAEPEQLEAWEKASPMRKMPLLVDGERIVPEATIIIEYVQIARPGSKPMIPPEFHSALDVRLLDRLADNYLMTPMQAIVGDRLRDEADRDPTGVARARDTLDRAYAWWDEHMRGRQWAAQDFGLADCACAPALFYADWVYPVPETCGALRDYRTRLLRRPSVARTVDEARPFRSLFPFGDPGRD